MCGVGSDASGPLAAAFALFESGLLVEAEAAYRSILLQQRGNADAWNMLGIILHRRGETAAGIKALEMAIEVAPRAPEALSNLGNLYKDGGDFVKAKRFYRKALALAPNHVMAHTNLAACLAEMGELDAAEGQARRAIEIDNTAMAAWLALANLFERRGDYARSLEVFAAGLPVFSTNADWHLQFGCLYMLAKRYDEAIVALQRALQLRPGFVEAMNNLGHVLFHQGRLEEAVAILQSAIALRPEMKELHINLANVWVAARRHADALASFQRVLELDAEHASAHFVLGMVLLVEGDFVNGWREYAWRWRTLEYGGRLSSLTMPQWTGDTSAQGKTLFVHAEQGIGDTLQFVRYLPEIRQRCGRLIVECQPPLLRLLQSMAVCDQWIARGDPVPAVDLHLPLLNCPSIIGTVRETIPAAVPYVQADPAGVAWWRQRLAGLGAGLKVGVAWAGNPDHANDRNRSMQLAQLQPLAELSGIRWISLQKGVGAEQLAARPGMMDLVDWTSDLTDFADTAALIENLDLVIAVDTSVVHLAGALNKPVWAMLPFAPDWRWLLDCSDSPWYPSLRLFRQETRGDWGAVVAAVAQALGVWVASSVSSQARLASAART